MVRRTIAESKKQVTAFYKYKQWAVACFLFYKIYFEPDKYKKHDKNSAFAYRTVETDRTFACDDAGKLLSVTETEAGCGTCVYTYEYDLMGNRTAAVKTNTAGTVVERRKYVYNESNQLTEAVLYDGMTTRKVQYTYDADGNLTVQRKS